MPPDFKEGNPTREVFLQRYMPMSPRRRSVQFSSAASLRERSEQTPAFVNVMVEHAWPCISQFATDVLGRVIEPAIKSALGNLGSKFGFDLNECNLGSKPAQFTEIQTHRTEQVSRAGKLDNLVLKGKLQWEGNVSIMTRFGSLPIGIKRVNVSGDLVLECVGMMPRPPFFQGIRLFFVNQPKIEMEFQGQYALTSVLELKTIKDKVMGVIERQIGSLMVVPNRWGMVLDKEAEIFNTVRPPPKGILTLKVVRAEGLLAMDHARMAWSSSSSDPYVVVRCGAERFKSATVSKSLAPSFDFEVQVPIVTVRHQRVQLELWDSDFGKSDDFLGGLELEVEHVVRATQRDAGATWFDLADQDGVTGSRGRILVAATWRHLLLGAEGFCDDGAGWVCAGIYSASQLPGQADGTRFWVTASCTGLASGRTLDAPPLNQQPDGCLRTSQLLSQAETLDPSNPEARAAQARLERKLQILRRRGLTPKEIAQVLEVDEGSVRRQATGVVKTRDLQATQRHTIVWNQGLEFLVVGARQTVVTFDLRCGKSGEDRSLGKCRYAVANLLTEDGYTTVETMPVPGTDIILKVRLELRFLASENRGTAMTLRRLDDGPPQH